MYQTCHPAVSIVVPVYKAERTIAQCVDSLLKQTLHDVEIILVDDGSPDNCGKIIDQYAQQYSCVKALHEQNSGVGTARNLGMSVAKGTYIAFVDADDWVLPNMYEKLYTTLQRTHADILLLRDIRKCISVEQLGDLNKQIMKSLFQIKQNCLIIGGTSLVVELIKMSE